MRLPIQSTALYRVLSLLDCMQSYAFKVAESFFYLLSDFQVVKPMSF